MAYIHKNIIGTLAKTHLIHAKTTGTDSLVELVIANVHNSLNCTIDLFIKNNPTRTTVDKYYILKNLILAKGTTLVLDSTDIGYDNKVYELYLVLHSNKDKVDLKLKTQ